MYAAMIPYRHHNVETHRNEMNPWNDDFFRAFFGDRRMMDTFRVDVQDKGDAYELTADLPGVRKEDVQVELEEGVLTISAKMNEEHEEKDEKAGNYLFRERRTGSMTRSFNVDGIREEEITATYADGVLKLTLPKVVEEPKSARHTIEIH